MKPNLSGLFRGAAFVVVDKLKYFTNMDIHSDALKAILGKSADKFTLDDIVGFILDNNVQMVNFMYPAADGRLKTLNFVVGSDEDYLRSILTCGERVDGSSLFPFIEAGSSDLYVVPRLRTAFMDPFSGLDTICFLCAFFDKDGNRLESSPEYTLAKAKVAFEMSTGMTFEAMGELEYYVSAPEDDESVMYPAEDQRGYHESMPFAKFNEFRSECMHYIMLSGAKVKYGHSEVGNFRLDGRIYEQNEIEFLPTDVEEAADSLMVAKWIINNLSYKYGFDTSFAPKITEGKAGSGLHIHMRIMKDGKNMMLDADGKLSEIARRSIAGMMELAPSITAFGNTNPTSYLRLVPHQEAPTNICWGDRNRSVLVRVPLGWTGDRDMFTQINPSKGYSRADKSLKQTVEIRSADCSADIYQLLASLCVACRHGLELADGLEVAERTYVDVNIHKEENKARLATLSQLPDSCVASAKMLEGQRGVYEESGVFSPAMIDSVISRLRSYEDEDIRARIKEDPQVMKDLVRKYYYV